MATIYFKFGWEGYGVELREKIDIRQVSVPLAEEAITQDVIAQECKKLTYQYFIDLVTPSSVYCRLNPSSEWRELFKFKA